MTTQEREAAEQLQAAIDKMPCGQFVTFPENFQATAMSLRDWFAGMALQGILANSNHGITVAFVKHAVVDSYIIADAMLDKRSEAQKAKQ